MKSLLVHFVFTHEMIGEHGSPLQYGNYFATFIKLHLSNVICHYLRASNERPYGLFIN